MKIPRREIYRNYLVEKDPNPNYRIFPCDFEELEIDENEWH